MESLQDQIKKTSKGGTLEIPYGGEFQEKLVINKPITIRSNFAIATIVGNSPTITIKKKGVTLENIHIESCDESGICLSIKKGINVNFKNVFIRGKVEGLEEEGEWDIPDALELPLVPNKSIIIKMIIQCPVLSRIYPSDIASVKCSPSELSPGVNEINIIVDEVHENAIVSGDFIIETLKHKLKRKISLIGNTFNSQQIKKENVGEYIWVCDSAKCDIDDEAIKNLPEGNQDVAYQFILDEKRLHLSDYDLQLDDLPEGLAFNDTALPYRIEGVPEGFGEFELIFIFSNDNNEYKFSSTLKINEKIIIPLKIKPLPDPIEAVEDDEIRMIFDILSSNSSNITFQTEKKLPGSLSLKESTGEINGRIANHGTYDSIIKISDGTNELNYQLKFYVKPKNPLELEVEKTYQFYKNEDFEIPIIISDEKRLKPTVNITSKPSVSLKVEFKRDNHYIVGHLTDIKEYTIKINVKDIYNRQVKRSFIIHCIEKPTYSVKWMPDSPIYKKGNKYDSFSIQINAEISEDSSLKPKYSREGNWPSNYSISKSGTLTGKIDGNPHLLKVRAEVNEWRGDMEFEVITIADSTRIVTQEGPILSDIFKNHTDNNMHDEIAIKQKLKKGRVNVYYKDKLIEEKKEVPKYIAFTINYLPEGLLYNPNDFSIEGTPRKEGTYSLEAINTVDHSANKIYLEIEKSPYKEKTTSKIDDLADKKKEDKPKVKLGKAFQ